MTLPVAIIGGGLTGLALARHLSGAGIAFRLFEARPRLGGRILTEGRAGDFDLGPSWFWPGQDRMTDLVAALSLGAEAQYAQGAQLFETAQSEVIRERGFASMQGSWRVRGGMGALVRGLADRLPADRIEAGRAVTSVSAEGDVGFADGTHLRAAQVVLAMPPRVAAELCLDPAPDAGWLSALRAIPTWMAGHAKLVAVYDRPFWRDAGLSGDASSQRGPLIEIHDASDGQTGALFGFVGVPPAMRAGREGDLREAALAQLVRLFGPQAGSPLEVLYKDWAADPETAVASDADPLTVHPDYGRPAALHAPWGGHVHVAATELAPEMGGYLEGALAAAEDMFARIIAQAAGA